MEARRNGLNVNSNPRTSINVQLAELISETKFLSIKDPVETLVELQLQSQSANKAGSPQKVSGDSIAGKTYPECLLQYLDIFRLKALIYRDVVRNDRNKVKPYVVVV